MYEWSCGSSNSGVSKIMDFGAVSSQRYFVSVSAFLVLLFTMLEPANLTGAGFFFSLLFWTVQIALLMSLLISVQMTMQKVRILDRLNVWIKVAVGGLISSFLFIPFALGIDYVLGLDDWNGIKKFHDILPLINDEIGGVVGPVALTWIGINAPRILRLDFRIPTADPNIKEEKSDPTALKERNIVTILPKKLGQDIIYIASEMHYLRIVTTKGETLELYSLQTAIKELSAIYEGIQTHRAYWVNKAHIDQIVGKPANRQILTKQDYVVPISRRRYTLVKEFLE